jgi:hypothetical protein
VTHFKSQLGGDLVMNLAIETRGSTRWRAASAFGGAYGDLRRRAAATVRRVRKRPSK